MSSAGCDFNNGPQLHCVQLVTPAHELVPEPTSPSNIGIERVALSESDDALLDAEYVDVSSSAGEYELLEATTDAHPCTEVGASFRDKIHNARANEGRARHKYQRAKETVAALEMLMREQGNRKESNCTCLQCASWSEVPAPVADYFQLECNAFVRNERIEELEMERKELATAHERTRDLDDHLCSTYQQFEAEYKQRRQELVEGLAVEHYRLTIQRNICLAQNFDPERFRYRRI